MTQVWRTRAGEQIRLLREQRGWSQDYLLKRLRELSGDPEFYKGKESISFIEKGTTAPPWDKMLQIARLLNTTVEALAGLEPPPPPQPLQYTNNIQGDSYMDSVVVGGPSALDTAHYVYEKLRAHGVYFLCATCHADLRTAGHAPPRPGAVPETPPLHGPSGRPLHTHEE
jgi:transcriptional regulator with XRE-family HTH domain